MVVNGYGAATMPRRKKAQPKPTDIKPQSDDTSTGAEPSETVRVPTRVMDMIREICHRTKDDRGKRLKLNHYVLERLEPIVLEDFNRVMQEGK